MIETNDISIRAIQHYLYCPHRWGLIEVERAWVENMFVTKANIMHERVHDAKVSYTSLKGKCYNSVSVYNDREEYGLYGVIDCLEIGEDGSVVIVEYKPTKPKGKEYNDEDLMQVFAQKICVDSVFNCDCEGVLYYGDVKKRIKLPLKKNFSEYDVKLKGIIKEMRNYMETGKVPKVEKVQYCNGCSFETLCMPSVKASVGVRKNIENIMED